MMAPLSRVGKNILFYLEKIILPALPKKRGEKIKAIKVIMKKGNIKNLEGTTLSWG